MRHVTAQEIFGPDPEPMYVIQVKLPTRAGETVFNDLACTVGDTVYEFEKTIPDRDWYSRVTGHYPPGYRPDDTETEPSRAP
jgi:hypothetical protein